jgi:uncharacterized protein YcbK (DUF882 family)
VQSPRSDRCASRRSVLKLGLAAAAATLAPQTLWARSPELPEKRLSFQNLHTGESLTSTFWARGDYVWEGLREVNHVLRDFRTGDVYPIDVKLLDLLHDLDRRLGGRNKFSVISGYRSPSTNAILASADHSGVAKNSLHMSGRAIDIRIESLDLAHLHQVALDMKRGGVGYYPKSQFVHVDVGPVRFW